MIQFQIFNGKIFAEDEPVLLANNRSYRYGDGFFESMRVANGEVLQLSLHWTRIVRTAKFLQLTLPQGFDKANFESYCKLLCDKNGLQNAAIRFKAYRGGAGTYQPENNLMEWGISALPLDNAAFELNKKGLIIGLFKDQAVAPAPLSNFKTSNALPYVLGTLHANKKNWDDCLMLDVHGNLVETTNANIFLVQGKTIVTPDLSTGGLQGIMRQEVMKAATALGFKVKATILLEEDLLKADECFTTNSIKGVQWVMGYGKKRYFHRVAEALIQEINRSNNLS
ncbi:aminotransferase class IV [Bacteroidota bacterium]